MFKRLSFRRKLLVYLFPVFVVFISITLLFQYNREKNFRKKELEVSLSDITAITHNYLEQQGAFVSKRYSMIDSVEKIFPRKNIRISLIDLKGKVLYDNYLKNVGGMENHLDRPEIKQANSNSYGIDIRKSASTHQSYYYYAHKFPKYYIRTALVYNVEIVDFLRGERFFIFFNVLLTIAIWLALLLVINKISNTISKLKLFASRLKNNEEVDFNIDFPNDEIGDISKQIVQIYEHLKLAEKRLIAEKERLAMHLFSLNDGVAFFNSERKKILANNQFIKLLNHASDKPIVSPEQIFGLSGFEFISEFTHESQHTITNFTPDLKPQIECLVHRNGRYINTRCIVLNDKSFEIVLTDITSLEKRKRLKQQITSNISHELKTPVTSIKGYLETLQNSTLDPEKRYYFVSKAIAQVERLNELIADLSKLNKIEEARDLYPFELINIHNLVQDVAENLLPSSPDREITVNNQISSDLQLRGNSSLLFSVFLNLMENAIKYGGENVCITIAQYHQDEKFYHFVFTDNGPGIPEGHSLRIFERFYRIDDGRSRKTGGTGLGLAIVKNAIQLHNGDISVKNRPEGGLEFLFTLAK
jgi:signal transduction histidine kinase